MTLGTARLAATETSGCSEATRPKVATPPSACFHELIARSSPGSPRVRSLKSPSVELGPSIALNAADQPFASQWALALAPAEVVCEAN